MTKTFTLRRAGLTLAAMIFSVVASAQTVFRLQQREMGE